MRWLGQALISTNNIPAAVKFCDEQIAANSPVAIDCLMLRASLRAQAGDFAGAAADYGAALKTYPENPDLHFRLGLMLENESQWAQAEAEFQRVLTLAPSYPDALEHFEKARAAIIHQ